MRREHPEVVASLLVLTVIVVVGAGCQQQMRTHGGPTSRTATAVDTETAWRLHLQAIDLVKAGDLTQAERLLQQALQADMTYGPAHNALGTVHFNQQRYYEAAWDFRYAAKLMPYQVEPKNNLGLVLERVGKLDEAVEHYQAAYTIQPDNPQLIGNLSRARIRRGDRDATTRRLLDELILKADDETWRTWAEHTRALMRRDPPTQTEGN